MSLPSDDSPHTSMDMSMSLIGESQSFVLDGPLDQDEHLLSQDNYEEGIFTHCLDQKHFSAHKECLVCQNKASLLSKLKNCHFCGGSVCKNHLKRRPDPQHPDQIKPICTNCNNRFLSKFTFKDLEDQKTTVLSKLHDAKKQNSVLTSCLAEQEALKLKNEKDLVRVKSRKTVLEDMERELDTQQCLQDKHHEQQYHLLKNKKQELSNILDHHLLEENKLKGELMGLQNQVEALKEQYQELVADTQRMESLTQQQEPHSMTRMNSSFIHTMDLQNKSLVSINPSLPPPEKNCMCLII